MSTTTADPITAAINRNIAEHPEWIGDLDRCAACGREIPKEDVRRIVFLGSEDGEEILITRACVECAS
jgi:hypothetical protein